MIDTNLAVLLAERGLTITQASRETGISRQTLTTFTEDYSGGIKFETLNKLCQYLDVSPGELFNYTPYDYSFHGFDYYGADDEGMHVGEASNRYSPDGEYIEELDEDDLKEYVNQDSLKVEVSFVISVDDARANTTSHLHCLANIKLSDLTPCTHMFGIIKLGAIHELDSDLDKMETKELKQALEVFKHMYHHFSVRQQRYFMKRLSKEICSVIASHHAEIKPEEVTSKSFKADFELDYGRGF